MIMSEQVSIYITWRTKNWYKQESSKNKRSLSSEISTALEENIKRKEKGKDNEEN